MFVVSLLVLVPLAATAQDPSSTSGGQGYVFYGPGTVQGGGIIQQVGGGGEGFLYKGLAVRGELGYMFPSEGFSYGIGLISANASYHLTRSVKAKFVPFVTGGYSLGFRDGFANMYNFGGGVTWWMNRHLGVRMEFRDYVWPIRGCGSEHLPTAQFGISFR
jgi:hypothetical protein